MQTTASALPLTADQNARFEDEVAHILEIYQMLFDDRQLSLLLNEGDNPRAGQTKVFEDAVTFGPQHLQPKFLGHFDVQPPFPHARPTTVCATIPSVPTRGEWDSDGAAWRPPRRLKALYRLSPLLYEHLRYAVEMRRWRLSEKRHNWLALPFNPGILPRPKPSQTDKRPAILIGFHWLEIGGAEKLAFQTVNWALEVGLRVFVVASVPSLQRLADQLPDHPDISFIRLDRYLPHDYWPRYLEKLIAAENIRLIHLHHCTPLYASLAHIRATSPEVTIIDSTHIIEYQDGGYPRISGVWSNYLDLHHVISNQLVRFFQNPNYQRSKVRLGRMLPRIEGQIALPALNMSARKKKLNFIFIGRYQYQKRPSLILYILRDLKKWAAHHGVTLHLRMVGEGFMRPAVEALARRLSLTAFIEFLPANSDVPALLQKSDVLLLPSNNEGLALVCYEAIRHGCIPITTDVGGQNEIIPPDLLVSLNPRAAIKGSVAAIDRLWQDQDYLLAQQKSLQSLYNKLSADPTAKEVLLPIYQAIVTGKVLPL